MAARGGARPGAGRKKGSLAKATIEFKAFWTTFYASTEYRQSAKERILAGRAPHLESYTLQLIHGKPPETVNLQGQVSVPLFALPAGVAVQLGKDD